MSGITQIKVSMIVTSLANQRKSIDEKSIAELAESLTQVGMIQPIVVRELSNYFEIVCGERRFRAASLAKLKEVPCIVRNLTDDEAEDLRITENLQRTDISPLDEATAYKLLIEHRQYTPLMIAQRFGKSETYIRHRLQLNNLIDDFAKLLEREIISLGHSLEICKLTPEHQANFLIDNFRDVDSRWFRVPTVKSIRDSIERNYSSKLALATFRLDEVYECAELPCIQCPKNTAFNKLLFPELQTEGICLDPVCYAKKTGEHFEKNLNRVIEDEPSTILLQPMFLSSLDSEKEVDQLIARGLLVKTFVSGNIVTKPEAPEEPSLEESEKDPDADLEYIRDFNTYEKELEEYEQQIEAGALRKCLIVAGREKGREVYIQNEKIESKNEVDAAEHSEVKELKEKDKRNKELVFEKTYLEQNALLAEMNYTRYSEPLTETEQDALMLIMYYSTSMELRKSIGIDRHDMTIHKAIKITTEQRAQVMRSFIANKLHTGTPGYMKDEANALMQIARERFPDESMAIEKAQDEVYLKRKKSIDERIYALEHMQVNMNVK